MSLEPDDRAFFHRRRWPGLLWPPLVALSVAFAPTSLRTIDGVGARPAYAAAVAVLMALYWFTEAIPIAWTALLPLLLFPLLGVFEGGLFQNVERSAAPFVDAYVFLFMGGMALGAAMETWGLHRRVALHILRAVGTNPRQLLFGMLLATASVSLWISNTATAVMMVPIAVALVEALGAAAGRRLRHLGHALLLSVAYGSNVGGIGTKIGTATNSIFVGFVASRMGKDIGFLEFMAFGVPFVAMFLPVVWLALWSSAKKDDFPAQGRELIEREIAGLGPMRTEEKKVAFVFGLAALFWMVGDPLRKSLAGLDAHLVLQGKHYEALVSMSAAALLALWGALPFRALRRVPWSTLLLIGGSFAMAAGLEGSGLSQWLARSLSGLARLPMPAQLLAASLATVLLSAAASNTATVTIALNVLPRALPILSATAIAASCDFMLPAGTPPNAIVFGSGYVRLPAMMKTGFWLDIAAAVLAALWAGLSVPLLFGS